MTNFLLPPQRLGPIVLAPDVSRYHAINFLIISFFSIGLMIFISSGQTYILNEHLKIPAAEQGSISGHLVFLTEMITLIFFLPTGILIDRLGRRSIYAIGFLLLALTYVLYPFAQSVGELYGYRLIYGLGVVAVAGALSTIMVDYPAEISRGKLVALIGVLTGLGIVFIQGLGGALPKIFMNAGWDGETAGQYTHFIVAAACIGVAGLVMIGLRPGIPIQRDERPSVNTLFKSGFTAIRNPRIALAYSAAFIARGDQSINATFLILWGTLAGKAAGMEPAEAIKHGTFIFIIAQVAALAWAPILGAILDRIDRVTALAICMALSAAGNLVLLLLDDPLATYGIGFFILLGIGQISVFLGAQSLIGQEAPLDKRGSIMAAFNIFGAIGILLITLAGGYLFDAIDPRAPFVVVGVINILLLIASVMVRRHDLHATSAH